MRPVSEPPAGAGVVASWFDGPGTFGRLEVGDAAVPVRCWLHAGGGLRLVVQPALPGGPDPDPARTPGAGMRCRLVRPDRRGLAVLDVEVTASQHPELVVRPVADTVVQRRRHTRAAAGWVRLRWDRATARRQLLDLSESGARMLVPVHDPAGPPAVGTRVEVELTLSPDAVLVRMLSLVGTVCRHDPVTTGTVVAVAFDEEVADAAVIRAAVLRAQVLERRGRQDAR